MLNRNQIVAWALVLVSVMLGSALPAAADSVTFAKGDMAVIDQGGTGKHLYYVKADGSAKTLMGTYGGDNLWDVAFTPAGQLVVAYDSRMYRVDPGNFTPASPGNALTVTGMAGTGFDGVAVGKTGTIYVDAYNAGQNRYFRLTSTGVDTFNATAVGGSVGWNWQVAIESDAPGAAKLLGFSDSTSNLYRMSEATGTNTLLNGSAIVNPAYSIAFDEANKIAYAGSYSATVISKVDITTGTTTQSWVNMGSAVRGLEFYNDKLYAVKTTSNGGIFMIDPATAASTQVGSVTFDSPRGIAIFNPAEAQDIPEPMTMALIASGLAGLGRYLRRRSL